MDFEGGAELNGWLYGLTDQPLPFYEGMRGYLSSEGDSESLAMLADSENHLPQHRIPIDSAALMFDQLNRQLWRLAGIFSQRDSTDVGHSQSNPLGEDSAKLQSLAVDA